MLRKIGFGLLTCSAFAGMFLAATEDADAFHRRARRRARNSYSSAGCCASTHGAYQQGAYQQGTDQYAPSAPTDPGVPPAASAEPTQAPPPPAAQ